MKVTLVSYGTAGDVRPLVALAIGLRTDGHEVVLAGDADGAALAASFDLDFRPLAGRLRDLIAPGGAAASTMEAGRLTVRSMRDYRFPDAAWLDTIEGVAAGADVLLGMPVVASTPAQPRSPLARQGCSASCNRSSRPATSRPPDSGCAGCRGG